MSADVKRLTDERCPECNDGYPEFCPVCQLDGHPVVEKLRAELNALRPVAEAAEKCGTAISENFTYVPAWLSGHWYEMNEALSAWRKQCPK